MHAERLSAYEAAPAAMHAVQQVEAYIQQCGLEKKLTELVEARAFQISGWRAALIWTETLTHVADTHAPDGAYDEVRRRLADNGLVHLSILIGLIKSLEPAGSRLSVSAPGGARAVASADTPSPLAPRSSSRQFSQRSGTGSLCHDGPAPRRCAFSEAVASASWSAAMEDSGQRPVVDV
jgi:hypothetical protein